jgi:hypothetical protein
VSDDNIISFGSKQLRLAQPAMPISTGAQFGRSGQQDD